MKQVIYLSCGVGTMFFIFMSILGGKAAASRFLEKDTATVHKTKFMAHVSCFFFAFLLVSK